MKRIGISLLAGALFEGGILILSFGHGHFGPCGPADALGMSFFVTLMPGLVLGRLIHVPGAYELAFLLTVAVLTQSALVWGALAGYAALKRRKSDVSTPSARPVA